MSETTREHLDTFWELVDEMLNAVLFVLIGLEVLVLGLSGELLLAGAVAVPLVLLARFVAVGVPIGTLRLMGRPIIDHATKVLTWGGLKGGISIALALSLRDLTRGDDVAGGYAQAVIAMTYVVVVFSILVQGLTVGPLLRRLGLTQREDVRVEPGHSLEETSVVER